MTENPNRRVFQFSLSTLLIAVAWVSIAGGVWRTFGPPWPVEINDWRNNKFGVVSLAGVYATLVELVAFLVFMQIWRHWPDRTQSRTIPAATTAANEVDSHKVLWSIAGGMGGFLLGIILVQVFCDPTIESLGTMSIVCPIFALIGLILGAVLGK